MTLIKIGSKNNQTKEVLKPVNLDIEKESKIKIWLVDPTYTQQQISSESMPSAVGGIATFTEKHLNLKNPIRIFKYPEKLTMALENEIPDVIGFSNYMWNSELSLALARRIKEYAADTIVVMGGPNYPVVESEQEIFLRNHPEIDFHNKKLNNIGTSDDVCPTCLHQITNNDRNHIQKEKNNILGETLYGTNFTSIVGKKNLIGFQFHPECTRENFKRWQLSDFAAYGRPGAQTQEQQDELGHLYDPIQAKWLGQFLTDLVGPSS